MAPEEVKAARMALGMTQDQFAAALNLDGDNRSDTVRSWEKGRRPCRGPAVVAIRYLLKFGPLEP